METKEKSLSQTKKIAFFVFGFIITTIAIYTLKDKPKTLDPSLNTLDYFLIEQAREGEHLAGVRKINDQIYQGIGFSNLYLVKTNDGDVLIDASQESFAKQIKSQLKDELGELKYIIITHHHTDHTAGIDVWKTPETKIIGHKNYYQLIDQEELGIAEQDKRAKKQLAGIIEKNTTIQEPDIIVDDFYELKLGELTFQIYYSPGETKDHVIIFIPELKALFAGDNYYETLPNIYPPRGADQRDIKDYINFYNLVLDLQPEYLLPGHGEPTIDQKFIKDIIISYKRGIEYINQKTLEGITAGKPLYQIVSEVKLPDDIQIPEIYSKVSWMVRGIYTTQLGWFDGQIENLLNDELVSVYDELYQTIDKEKLYQQINLLFEEGNYRQSLILTQILLYNEPQDEKGLKLKIKILEEIYNSSENIIERNWIWSELEEIKKS